MSYQPTRWSSRGGAGPKPTLGESLGPPERQETVSADLAEEPTPSAVGDLQEKLRRAQEELRLALDAAAYWEGAARASEERHHQRVNELVILTCLLEQQEQRNAEFRQHSAWMAAVRTCLQNRPGWWQLMPAKHRREWERRRLKRARLFDHDAYLEHYPDVAAAKMDALDHYVHHGLHEGRSRPSEA